MYDYNQDNQPVCLQSHFPTYSFTGYNYPESTQFNFPWEQTDEQLAATIKTVTVYTDWSELVAG